MLSISKGHQQTGRQIDVQRSVLNLDEPLEEFIHSLKFATFKGHGLLRRLCSASTVGTEGHSFT